MVFSLAQAVRQPRNLAALCAYLQTLQGTLQTPQNIASVFFANEPDFATLKGREKTATYPQVSPPFSVEGSTFMNLTFPSIGVQVMVFCGGNGLETTFLNPHRNSVRGRLPDMLSDSDRIAERACEKVVVHQQFKSRFARMSHEVLACMQAGLQANVKEIIITGHSTGAALGHIAAVFVAVNARESLTPRTETAAAAPTSTAAALVAGAVGVVTSEIQEAADDLVDAASAVTRTWEKITMASTDRKRNNRLREDTGVTRPENFFADPHFSRVKLTLTTFGEVCSGNADWVDMVDVAVRGRHNAFKINHDAIVHYPSNGVTTLSDRYSSSRASRTTWLKLDNFVTSIPLSFTGMVNDAERSAMKSAAGVDAAIEAERAALVTSTAAVVDAADGKVDEPAAAAAAPATVTPAAAATQKLVALLAEITRIGSRSADEVVSLSGAQQTWYAARVHAHILAGHYSMPAFTENHTIMAYIAALKQYEAAEAAKISATADAISTATSGAATEAPAAAAAASAAAK